MFNMSSIVNSGDQYTPLRLVMYGVQGIGKTTFAASFESPIILRTEDGAEALNVATFPQLAKNYTDVISALTALHNEAHNFKTLIIDSLDWLEPIILQSVIDDFNVNREKNPIDSIEKIGYGKGYILADTKWRNVIAWLDALRFNRGMQIVCIAHCKIKIFQDPEGDPFDRYQIKMHERAVALWQEWSDNVIFCNYQKHLQVSDSMSEKKRAVGTGERVLYSEERPAYIAKNRRSLPSEIFIGKDKTWYNFHEAMAQATNGRYINPQKKG